MTDQDVALEPIFVGGDRRAVQEREQWSSGCNFAAMRPGLVTAYSRNEGTLREMEKMGFAIVPAVSFTNTKWWRHNGFQHSSRLCWKSRDCAGIATC